MGLAVVAILVLRFVYQAPLISIVMIVLALILAWEYSAPPLRLHSRGFGEFTVGLIVPVLTPLVGYSLQAGETGLLPILTVFPLFCFQIAMVLMINVPDVVGDQQSGKQTLVTRLGPDEAMKLYIVLLVLAYLSVPYLVFVVLPIAVAVAYLIPLPIAVFLMIRIRRGDWQNSSHWNSLAFWSIVLLVISAFLIILAYLWLVLV
jgi:1,4-dihydroxy-2-naphthoate octaprenyltransferase